MNQLKRIPKFIYFDAGNVLFYKVRSEGENIADTLGFPKDDYESIIAKVAELQGEEAKEFMQIRTLEDEIRVLNKFHRKMCEYLKIEATEELVNKLTRFRTNGDFALKPGVVDSLKRLSSKYRLGVLSNALPSRKHHELKLENIDSFFEAIIISWEEGCNKPDPKIYKIAIDKANVAPEDILFVDDKVSFLEGALSVGIDNLVLMKRKEESDLYPMVNDFNDLEALLEQVESKL